MILPSINLSDVNHQEIPEEYWENFLVEIMAKLPDNITLTLTKEKFLEKTRGNSNGAKYLVEFPSGQQQVKFQDANLQNYVLDDLPVVNYTMGCVCHGSSNEIQSEWDPGHTYHVERLWEPGGPSYMSTSCYIVDLERLGKPKHYLDYFHLLLAQLQ